MVQVLTNLLGNAIVHGTDETPVRVAVDGRDARTLRIGVRNAGQVPAELLPRLFEPFKSAHRRSDGLGLGLYIVDQFVRAHGGQASVGNTEAGVLFEVAIPRGIGA
ncbi:ATP-binding protein [Frateuria sp. STR12]|nr:ATP-binding protein [Frateuria sp. STR12]